MHIIIVDALADDATYVGHNQCRICHNSKDDGEQWAKWKAGPHADAFDLLKRDEAKKVGEELGLEKPPSESPECLRCHVTAYDPVTLEVPDKIKLTDGVQCGSCHGPSSTHVVEGKKFKSGDETAQPKALAIHPDEQVCKKCHNDTSPTWRNDRYTLEDGTQVGFDFKQAWAKISHSRPE